MSVSAVRLEQVPSVPLAVIRRTARAGELARVVPECCGLVWNVLRAQHAAAGRNVAVYWDGSIRLEVGVELLGSFIAQGEVVRSATPGGLAASITHLGPYNELAAAHNAVRDWCKTHRHDLAGPSWEIYGHWQAHWNTDPSQIRTDVYYQISPAAA